MSAELHAYLILVLVGFLPSEVWRWLGIVLGRGLDDESEIILWVRAVATALIAGVVARIVVIPPGALAGVPLSVRLVALAAGFFAFLFIRRSAFAGVVVGEAVLVAGAMALGGRTQTRRAMSTEPPDPPAHVAFQVFLDGVLAAVRSVFFYVLIGNYIGMGALAHEVGFSFWWMGLSTLLIWAAPAQVILLSTLTTASLWEVALAVTLTSVRFLPMVAAILPVMRHAGVRPRDLLLPMHLTAISVWVEGMRLLPLMPAERRVAFYNGLGTGLMSGALIGGAIGFVLAAKLPPLLGAALLFFTPMAILMSSARNSRTLIDGLSFALGLVVGPIVAAQKIGLDLMWTGLIAGTMAYVVHRVREARRARTP